MAKREVLEFGKPAVSPRAYVAKGPSGWAETFDRKTAEAELAAWLGAAPVALAVDTFIAQRALADKQDPTNWHTVIGFLGRLRGASPFEVPVEAAIAFWGQVELAIRARGAN